VTDPIEDRDALAEALRLVADEATRYLAAVDASPVRPPGAGAPGARLAGPLPEHGDGSLAAVGALIDGTWEVRPALPARGSSTS
jgi:hypothetical protein